MGYGWYLAADFQLYLILPLFILPLIVKSWRRLAVPFYFIALVAHIMSNAWMSVAYNLPALPTPQGTQSIASFLMDVRQWQQYYYSKPYPRIGLVGIAVLFAYWCVKKRSETATKASSQLLIWAVRLAGIGMLLTCIFMPYDTLTRGERWSSAGNAVYNTLSRMLWAIGLSCFLYPSLIHTKADIMQPVFEWKLWTVLSRLTYAVYLVHILVLVYFNGQNQQVVPVNALSVVSAFGNALIWSYVLAIVLHLSVELPFGQLIKQLFKPRKH
jgi:peptidoglycan/LPS O-acetylase OafA/YrhL